MLPLDKPHPTLGTLGVGGLVGGDEAASAMAAVHVYENRRWLGWYNSPGSYQIAGRYRLLAKSRSFDGFSPCVHTDPIMLFELDGWKGPKFSAAHSGTIIQETGYLAALFARECAALKGGVVEGRETGRVAATIAELNYVPDPQVYPKRINAHTPTFACIPIFVSVGSCVMCGVFRDWYLLSMIALGILANGISCFVIGSGNLVFTHPKSAAGSPSGDGILISDKGIVLLKGMEGAVNCITRGKLCLSFSSESHYQRVGWCSFLLTIQFIAQLLLTPQGSLFGQIMFATSFGVSWVYNSWLSSQTKTRDILFSNILNLKDPNLTKYIFGTRTTMAVFVLYVLQPKEPEKILNELLPNDTGVWKAWKDTVAQRFRKEEKLEFVDAEWAERADENERVLLKTLYKDAETGYTHYKHHSAQRCSADEHADDLQDPTGSVTMDVTRC